MLLAQPIPNLPQASAAAACGWGLVQYHAFWRAASGRLQHLHYPLTHANPERPDERAWRSETFDDVVPDAITACSWGPDRIDIFWRRSPSELGQKSWVGRWENWTHRVTGGGPPAACSWGVGRIDLFWVEPGGGSLVHKWWNGSSWDNQESIPRQAGVPFPGRVAACAWGPGRLDIFWHEPSGNLGQLWTGAHGTERWQYFSHDAKVTDVPSAACWAPGVIDIFAPTTSNQILHKWWEQGWSNWVTCPGMFTSAPAAASAGDGRLSVFAAGTDGNCWQLYHGGQPLTTRADRITTVGGVARRYRDSDVFRRRADLAARLLTSFAVGTTGNCSGTMVSPHIFMAAGHCGGVGHVHATRMFHIDQFGRPGEPGYQEQSEPFQARGLPWAHFWPGDTHLFWLPDAADGTPPGIRYGYVEISERESEVGIDGYSFWVNPGSREDSTLLYSEGRAVRRVDDSNVPLPPGGKRLGPRTDYEIWCAGGGSGSSVIVPQHGYRSVGVAQGASDAGGPERNVPDITAFLGRFDADRNRILDAIEYDWLMTRPLEDFLLLDFSSRLQRARWIAVPGGGATGTHERPESLDGLPGMRAGASDIDCWWEQFARFRSNQTYRISVAVSPAGSTGSGYVKFRSDSTGAERRVNFRADAPQVQSSTIMLGPESDYRLVLGATARSSATVGALSLVAEGAPGRDIPVGFATHHQRRSWRYLGTSRPMSRGVDRFAGFSGVVVGPTGPEGGLANPWLALNQNRPLRMRFRTRAVEGPVDPAQPPSVPPGAPRCWLRLEGNTSFAYHWPLRAAGSVQDHDVVSPASSVPLAIVFGREGPGAYQVGDLSIVRA